MTSAQVDMALASLIALAWVWRGGCDKVLAVLAAAFLAAIVGGPMLHGADRHVLLGVIDYAIVFAMLGIWTVHGSMRAYCVGIIGLGKLMIRTAFYGAPFASHYTFAVVVNLAFALQVVAAGGLLDVMGRWIDRAMRAHMPRRYRLLHNGKG